MKPINKINKSLQSYPEADRKYVRSFATPSARRAAYKLLPTPEAAHQGFDAVADARGVIFGLSDKGQILAQVPDDCHWGFAIWAWHPSGDCEYHGWYPGGFSLGPWQSILPSDPRITEGFQESLDQYLEGLASEAEEERNQKHYLEEIAVEEEIAQHRDWD